MRRAITTTTGIGAKVDFDRVRYAQCWEDADILIEAMRIRGGETCLSIASAGDNTLALVGAGARRVIAVDLSPAQIACLELRVAAYRSLSYGEMLELLGHQESRRRALLYRRCRPSLSGVTRRFWDTNGKLIEAGIAQRGRFERYLAGFRKLILPLIHSRSTVRRLFELPSVAERRAFFDDRWNNRRWRFLCRVFFGRSVLDRFGRDPNFMTYADEPVWRSLERRIPDALIVQRPAENPYLQWILAGRYVTALPYALRVENFVRIRDNLHRLEWHCAPLEQVLAGIPPGTLHGCNLSDVFEYMSPEAYERVLEDLVSASAPGCRFVYWNVVVDRHRPAGLEHALRPLRDVSERLHARAKAFFYRDLVVEEVI